MEIKRTLLLLGCVAGITMEAASTTPSCFLTYLPPHLSLSSSSSSSPSPSSSSFVGRCLPLRRTLLSPAVRESAAIRGRWQGMRWQCFDGSLTAASSLTGLALVLLLETRPHGRVTLTEDALVVKPSTIPQAGLGLFAAVDIPAGTEIGRYAGSLWPQGLWLRWKGAKLGDVLSTAPSSEQLAIQQRAREYIWRLSNGNVLDPTDSDGTLLDHVPYILPWVKVSTKLSRMNEPSLGRDVNVVTEEDGDSLVMKAEFDIGAGEELFVDYGPFYDRDKYISIK